MKKNFSFLFFFTLSASLFFGNTKNEIEQKEQAKRLMKNQPVKFLENKGQMMDMDGKPIPFVLFKAEAPGVNLFITEQGLTIQTLKIEEEHEKENEDKSSASLSAPSPSNNMGNKDENISIEWERMDIILKGANIKKENIKKEGAGITNFNFFYGSTCPDGIYGVKEYEKIIIKDVYPGIDWVFYNSNEKGFKYDFVVHPEADYKQIELLYRSKTPIKINTKGEIELTTKHGDITENTPVSFLNGKEIKTQFTRNYQKQIEINGDKGIETSISFHLNSPSPSGRTGEGFLVIDPQLTWATFYGGNNLDSPMSITTDNSDNVLVTGRTGVGSPDFPVQTAGTFFQGTYGGGSDDAFMLKFDNIGNRLWATYYGGSGNDRGYPIALDGSGNVFVTGYTGSTDFPVQTAGTFFQGTSGGSNDAFMLKFDNLGNRLWATYYGGSGWDCGYSIATEGSGNVFVTGSTGSTDFPVQTAGTFFQGTNGGGGDAFMLKFDNLGNRLWATYYGGSGDEQMSSYDNLAIDNCGNVYVSFDTYTNPFPHLINTCDAGYYDNTYNGGNRDILLSLFSNSGTLLWCTYLGGDGNDVRTPLAVDANNNLFVSGEWTFVTNSATYPVTDPGGGAYYDATFNGGLYDGFMVRFAAPSVTYTQTQTNANCTCDGSATINICHLPPYSYVWSNGNSTLNTYNTTNTITGLCPGSYTVTATSNCNQSQTVTFVIAGVGSVTPSITGTTTICNGNSTTLTATGGGTYNWSTNETTTAITVSPTTNTTYTVTATDLGCSEATTVLVTVNPNPTPGITGTTTICTGNSTTLTATGGGTYNWSTNETTTAITVSPTNTTTYTVTADNAGCTGSTTVGASIVSPPTATAADVTACEGETINLTSSGGGTYTWNGPNAFTSTLQNPTITNPTVANSGIYTVTVSNGSCSDTATAMVTVNPTPNTNAGSDVTITPGSNTTLTAIGGSNYIWTPTTGLDCDTCANVTATPTATTIYCVQTNIGTCNSSDCVTVTIETPCPNNKDLAAPNAFSPNADGHNDDFCLQGWNTCIETFTILIYDRWGEKVFESEEANFCWDGMYRGKIMDPAVFVYYIKATFTNGNEVVKKGNVSLIK